MDRGGDRLRPGRCATIGRARLCVAISATPCDRRRLGSGRHDRRRGLVRARHGVEDDLRHVEVAATARAGARRPHRRRDLARHTRDEVSTTMASRMSPTRCGSSRHRWRHHPGASHALVGRHDRWDRASRRSLVLDGALPAGRVGLRSSTKRHVRVVTSRTMACVTMPPQRRKCRVDGFLAGRNASSLAAQEAWPRVAGRRDVLHLYN